MGDIRIRGGREGVSRYRLTLTWLTSMPGAVSSALIDSVRPLADVPIKAVSPDCCRYIERGGGVGLE